MALATLSDSPATGSPGTDSPGTIVRPGLSARMASLRADLAGVLADLDPGLLMGRDAADLYRDFARLERLVTAGKTLLAPRIAESGHWRDEGHRSPAVLLATLEGGSAGQARRTLEAGRSLVDLPGTEAALRNGTLSGPKLTEITQAASLDPSAEGQLLAGSDAEPLHVIKERCQRVRAASATDDPVATLARIHAGRRFTSWTDAEGAFCFEGRDSAERGAKLLARLAPVVNRLRHDRRPVRGAAGSNGAGTPGPPPPEPDPVEALRADALFLLLDGPRPGSRSSPGSRFRKGASDPPAADPPGDFPDLDRMADPDELGSAGDLVTAGPPSTIIVRVDLAALRRGRALPGELSELDGHGPVPVPVVRSLADDAFLACVFAEAGDIRAVAHLGRTINQHLRTALALRDRHCVVPGCGVAYSLEIDHVRPLESGGDTRLDNLALLCRHHHRLKTYEGWTLERTGATDEDPRWRFLPLPPFGQEPDLGLDRPDLAERPDAVPRT